MIRGSIDFLSEKRVAGWLYSRLADGPLLAQAYLFGRIIGEAEASLQRPDLFAAGIGDGNCGFDLRFYEPVNPQQLPMVAVRPQGGNVELPRTNITGFPNFFRAVQGLFPAAGRARSVFGGLWTDRSDSCRLLSGRVASGATAPDLEDTLRSFIENGYVVLRQVFSPLSDGDAEGIAQAPSDEALIDGSGAATGRVLDRLPEVLFDGLPLRLNRAILDDNPAICRAVIRRGNGSSFSQASVAEGLPSPAESLLSVIVVGSGYVEVDIVRGSHVLPEFTDDGRSRWVSQDAAAAVEIAVANGCSVDTVQVNPADLAILGPGTLHRVRTRDGASALCAWSIGSSQPPLSVLTSDNDGILIRHNFQAKLVI